MTPGRRTKLNPETQRIIVQYIRNGAFDYIAARAAGIGKETFYTWLNDPRPLYRQFRDEVEKARGEARVAAEIEVRRENPLAWLRYGPGRERRGEPGWTDMKQVSGPDGGAIPLSVVDEILGELDGEEGRDADH